MRVYRLTLLFLFCLLFNAGHSYSEETLLPGKSYGEYEMGAHLESIISIAGKNNCMSFKSNGMVFKDVFKVNLSHDIIYDLVLTCYSSGTTFFFKNNKLVCIVVKGNSARIEGSVSLKKGLESQRMLFGNSHAYRVVKYKSVLLLYLKYGVAFIDDNKDQMIDGFIVFQPK